MCICRYNSKALVVKKKKKDFRVWFSFGCIFESDIEVILKTHSRQLLSVKFCSKFLYHWCETMRTRVTEFESVSVFHLCLSVCVCGDVYCMHIFLENFRVCA